MKYQDTTTLQKDSTDSGDRAASAALQFIRRPQNVWLRKALFQIHLWTGIGFGLYILVISFTGSVLVFRDEMYGEFGSKPVLVTPSGKRMSSQELRNAAERLYPGYSVYRYWESPRRPNQAVEIEVGAGESTKQRLFNPYTGADIGNSVPLAIRILSFLKELHINLLFGDAGRSVNAIGAVLLIILCLTGLVIWWPGALTWRRALVVRWSSSWRRFNWDLHSALGFWMFGLMLMWGITGIHVSLPDTFWAIVDHFEPPDETTLDPPRRVGEVVLKWSAQLHFGNFSGWKVKALWVILGLAPVILFVTGAIMWWNRVLAPRWRRTE